MFPHAHFWLVRTPTPAPGKHWSIFCHCKLAFPDTLHKWNQAVSSFTLLQKFHLFSEACVVQFSTCPSEARHWKPGTWPPLLLQKSRGFWGHHPRHCVVVENRESSHIPIFLFIYFTNHMEQSILIHWLLLQTVPGMAPFLPWWSMLAIPALRGWKQEGLEFEVSLDCIARPHPPPHTHKIKFELQREVLKIYFQNIILRSKVKWVSLPQANKKAPPWRRKWGQENMGSSPFNSSQSLKNHTLVPGPTNTHSF